MKNFIKATVAITTIAALSSGCMVMHENEAAANAAIKKTETAYKKMEIKKPDSFVSYTKEVYLAGDAFKIVKKQILPEVFNQKITYTTAMHETFQQTVTNIGKLVGVAVQVSDDASKVAGTEVDKLSNLKSYTGTLRTVINELTHKTGLFWSYDNNIIKIFSVETKVYALDAPIGSYNVTSTITSSADNGGTGGTTNGSSSVNLNYNTKTNSPWDSAIATIKSMLSPIGRLDTNPVEGYVTITDNPERQNEINTYIAKINDKTNKKIAIRVEVYDVQTEGDSSHGLNINSVAKALGGSVNWLSNAQNPITSSMTATSSLSFKTKDTSVVLQALNTIGKATQMTATTVYTISGQPAPVQNSIQQNYLRSMSKTTSSDSGTTVSLEPGTVTTGYSMTLTPRIESSNEILINLNLQISDLLRMDTISSDGTVPDPTKTGQSQAIQLPVIHTKNFLENMILKSGQTILIAGFQNDKAAVDTSSLGNPNTWVLGGSKYTQKVRSTTVVVVTPYIIGR